MSIEKNINSSIASFTIIFHMIPSTLHVVVNLFMIGLKIVQFLENTESICENMSI